MATGGYIGPIGRGDGRQGGGGLDQRSRSRRLLTSRTTRTTRPTAAIVVTEPPDVGINVQVPANVRLGGAEAVRVTMSDAAEASRTGTFRVDLRTAAPAGSTGVLEFSTIGLPSGCVRRSATSAYCAVKSLGPGASTADHATGARHQRRRRHGHRVGAHDSPGNRRSRTTPSRARRQSARPKSTRVRDDRHRRVHPQHNQPISRRPRHHRRPDWPRANSFGPP